MIYAANQISWAPDRQTDWDESSRPFGPAVLVLCLPEDVTLQNPIVVSVRFVVPFVLPVIVVAWGPQVDQWGVKSAGKYLSLDKQSNCKLCIVKMKKDNLTVSHVTWFSVIIAVCGHWEPDFYHIAEPCLCSKSYLKERVFGISLHHYEHRTHCDRGCQWSIICPYISCWIHDILLYLIESLQARPTYPFEQRGHLGMTKVLVQQTDKQQ